MSLPTTPPPSSRLLAWLGLGHVWPCPQLQSQLLHMFRNRSCNRSCDRYIGLEYCLRVFNVCQLHVCLARAVRDLCGRL